MNPQKVKNYKATIILTVLFNIILTRDICNASLMVETCSGLLSYDLESSPNGIHKDFLATITYDEGQIFQEFVLISVDGILNSNIFCRNPSLQMQILFTNASGKVVNHSHDLDIVCSNDCLVTTIPQNSDPSVGGLTIPSVEDVMSRITSKYSKSDALLLESKVDAIEEQTSNNLKILGEPSMVRLQLDGVESRLEAIDELTSSNIEILGEPLIVKLQLENIKTDVMEIKAKMNSLTIVSDDYFLGALMSVGALLVTLTCSFARLWWRIRELEHNLSPKTGEGDTN